jgi:hypothetical protein
MYLLAAAAQSTVLPPESVDGDVQFQVLNEDGDLIVGSSLADDASDDSLSIAQPYLNFIEPNAGVTASAAGGDLKARISGGDPYFGVYQLKLNWSNTYNTDRRIGFEYEVKGLVLRLEHSGNFPLFRGDLRSTIGLSVTLTDFDRKVEIAKDSFQVSLQGQVGNTADEPFTLSKPNSLEGAFELIPLAVSPGIPPQTRGATWVGNPFKRGYEITGTDTLLVDYELDLLLFAGGVENVAVAQFGDPLGPTGITASFFDAPAAVPSPSILVLMATGLLALAAKALPSSRCGAAGA